MKKLLMSAVVVLGIAAVGLCWAGTAGKQGKAGMGKEKSMAQCKQSLKQCEASLTSVDKRLTELRKDPVKNKMAIEKLEKRKVVLEGKISKDKEMISTDEMKAGEMMAGEMKAEEVKK